MAGKFLCLLAIFFILSLLQGTSESKKVVIHVPYHVKNIKHTHTIYKVIPHHDKDHHHDSHDDQYDMY
ncbi:uncharacterized protein LOC111674292 [Orussus abietinus]|uniref:uncharacterized protein LOC111674292 n=1 Tax=Orussus abietinus TaxID=222816 RepID=UPI000C715B29|nr:uncharacterized protein LOC111674292 [Orussus abietinus]